MRGCQSIPLQSFDLVLRYAMPLVIKIAQCVLGIAIALLSGQTVPLQCLAVIWRQLRSAPLENPASLVDFPEHELSFCIAVFCSRPEPLQCSHIVKSGVSSFGRRKINPWMIRCPS